MLAHFASSVGLTGLRKSAYSKRTKRNKFHTDKIVELVRATPGCKVVPVANAGHWLYHESQQAELCFREVKAFVLGK